MEFSTVDLMLLTLPETLKGEGEKLMEMSRLIEEERLFRNGSKFRRHSKPRTHEEIQEKRMDQMKKARESAEPLAIAKLIMEIWSPKMRQHAEKVILNKAVQMDYLKESHLRWVFVLEGCCVEEASDFDWVIDDQDEAIIELIWNRFNMKQHFYDTWFHRLWIQRSYDRLKTFLPLLSAEMISRHDLSKFAFSQAVGYTLKWVHNVYNQIWKSACDLHLNNEPHHPQVWKSPTPEEKRKKLECWLTDVCDFRNGCPYGIDINNLDLQSQDFAEPFLQESFLDMVAVEWERKKGQRLDITTRELVYMDDKFLQRYSPVQHQIVHNLIQNIILSDKSWNDITLSEREKKLLSTIPQDRHAVIACQIENQKKAEVARQVKLANEVEKGSSKFSGKPSEEMIQRGHDIAYFITVCRVVTEIWNAKFRQYAEKLLLKKAVSEGFIEEKQVKWVSVFHPPIEDDSEEQIMLDDDLVLQILWEDFNLQKHFSAVNIHRYWVKQSYLRLSQFMKELPEEVIERHDLTKFALSQSLGYTLKFIHEVNYPVWRKACNMHLNCEPHHPEMWSGKHNPEDKQVCLENWLCVQAAGYTYGLDLSTLDFASEDMAKLFLLESLLDMVAVEWERNKGQRPDLTYTELVYMEDRFLARYSPKDKDFILELMSIIRQADKKTNID